MKVINLMNATSSPAPKEWQEIPEIKSQRPSPIGQENSLQRIDDTNVCAWFSNSGNGMWTPNSDFFLVDKSDSIVTELARIYGTNNETRVCVAQICDEVLDKSGGLLGKVRDEYRKQLK